MTPTPVQQMSNLCRWRKFTEDECMDLLQENGLVSDNCVKMGEVADCDAMRALEWMEKNMVRRKQ